MNKNVADIPHVYVSFEELLEKEDVLVIDICTPPSTHAPLSITAIKNGLHVLLAMSVEKCETDSERIPKSEKGKALHCSHFLFDPPILELQKLAKEDEILGVEIHMLHISKDEMPSNPNHWLHSLSGGRFGECLIHSVYTLRNLIGPLKLRDIHITKRRHIAGVKF